MSRLARYFLPDQPLHVIQRGNNRAPIFFNPEDHKLYLQFLGEAASALKVRVHAYVLMTNHVHLLMSPSTAAGIPRLMQTLGRRYVGHVNRTYRRTGTLWEGRYRAAPIEADSYLLACYRYIELNPVRARMTRNPGAYRWSSYRAHAEGESESIVEDHSIYLALGRPGSRPRYQPPGVSAGRGISRPGYQPAGVSAGRGISRPRNRPLGWRRYPPP